MTKSPGDSFATLTVHESEYPDQQRAALLKALRAGRMPSKLLYQSAAQTQRWLDYAAACSPSRSDEAVRALYRQAFAAVARQDGAAPVHLVGLGCGDGSKDAALLAALAARRGTQAHLLYTPMDASPGLVLKAALQARRHLPDAALHPLVVDLTCAQALDGWLAEHEVPGMRRVYSCLGLLPNMDHRAFPRWLGGLLQPHDVLLVSANLSPRGMQADQAKILPQYDTPLARAWYTGALAEQGFAPDAVGLRVAARALSEDGTTWQIVVTAELQGDAALRVHGAPLRFPAGTALEVFRSNRFTPTAIEGALVEAGLRIVERWISASREEGIYLCRGTGSPAPCR